MSKELPICPAEKALSIISSKWSLYIIKELVDKNMRFNELIKTLGVSQKVLTENLKKLEENNVIDRKVFPVIPPKVEYSLTEFGKTLIPVLDTLHEWGETL
ncbi:winged helix-turn-helix transcriptional regulator [Mesoplasma photuris]|uniref:winged helix-turn-helix transcriptional regulator n=1 Tax=Mesoplasma photuris TaxID=217731 RepID=UPI0004E14988|nr:helix-turn-helix domain-containing protein [Mesoplasma photuris]